MTIWHYTVGRKKIEPDEEVLVIPNESIKFSITLPIGIFPVNNKQFNLSDIQYDLSSMERNTRIDCDYGNKIYLEDCNDIESIYIIDESYDDAVSLKNGNHFKVTNESIGYPIKELDITIE